MLLEIGKSGIATRILGNYLKGSVFTQKCNFSNSLRFCSIYESRRAFKPKPLRREYPSKLKILKYNYSSNKSPNLLDRVTFENVSSETLESLTEYFEELLETVPKFNNGDVHYSDGVLTVTLGNDAGIYVINKQSSNYQIWLSSPKSGPKRYDYINGTWVYRHDKSTLHSLLDEEIGEFTLEEVKFTEKCLHAKSST